MDEKKNKRPYLKSIAGLKFFAIILVFFAHNGVKIANLDFSSRCVEFFFIASGFLCYYSHSEYKGTLQESRSALVKWLKKNYPLYFLTNLFFILFTHPNILICFSNLFMLQPWSNNEKVVFSLNGPTWFIAALFFCSALAPYIVAAVNSVKKKWIVLVLLIAFRYLLETLMNNSFISMSVHSSPLIRVFDYSLGVVVASLHIQFFSDRKINKILASVLEISALVVILFSDNYLSNVLPKTAFVAIICLLLFVFSSNSGILSKVLSLRFIQYASKVQLEFYMLHVVVGTIFYKLVSIIMPSVNTNFWVIKVLLFICIFVSAIVIHTILERINQYIKIKTC